MLVPFATTFLCESGFSTMVQIKDKYRNRLDISHDMRVALSKTSPRIADLVKTQQDQGTHIFIKTTLNLHMTNSKV